MCLDYQPLKFIIMKAINNAMLELRKKHNYTQSHVADLLGLDTSSYGKIERGIVDISLTKIEQLSEIYKISTVDLISFPEHYIKVDDVFNAQIEEKVSLTIELKKEKKDQVLKLVFGDNNLEILNK